MTSLTLDADENNLDQDFGYNSGTGSIGDTIFFDVDGTALRMARNPDFQVFR